MGQDNEKKSNPLKRSLCKFKGEGTSIYLDVEVTDEGNLVMSGQDIGQAPSEHWGDDDYEYWVAVPREEKDRLLLVPMEKVFGGHTSGSSEFIDLLKAKKIPYQFDSWA